MLAYMWNILGFIALILLISSFFRGPNSIWGGLTLGAIVGAITTTFFHSGFDMSIILKGGIVGVLIGAIADVLPRIVSNKQ